MRVITWRGAVVGWARPSDMHDFSTADLAVMGAGQLARHRGLSDRRASRFLAGRALIRELVVGLGGGPEVLVGSVCRRCGGDHGVPETPGFVLSVSHADDLVAVAVSRDEVALGVDIESNSAESRVAQLGPLFAEGAVPDLAGWTRIEAALKADGRGVAVAPGSVSLRPVDRAGEASGPPEWSAIVPGRVSPLRVATLPGPVGHTLSVARG